MSSENTSYEHRIKDAYRLLRQEWNTYLENFTLYLLIWVMLYVVLTCVLYVAYCRYRWGVNRVVNEFQRTLIVTAHPDDECMFFGPTILELHKRKTDVYLICLSDGNFNGKGAVRRDELWKACNALGIPDTRILLCSDTRLPDDPNAHWDTEILAELIGHHIGAYDFDSVITFDKGGVSGHSNHSNLFYALAFLCLNKQLPERCRVFTLDSINILRKYWSYLDLPFSFLMSSIRFVLTRKDYRIILKAMLQHKSQMVWFRYLYIVFSRYMYVNTLREYTILDFELELELEELEAK